MLKGLFKKTAEEPVEEVLPSSKAIVDKDRLEPEKLRRFQVFSQLAHDELVVFSEKLELQKFKAGDVIFSHGDEDKLDYLLYSGTVELISDDGRKRELVGGTDSASLVLSSLRPRKYTATATTNCTCVVIEQHVIAHLPVAGADTDSQEDGDYQIDELPQVETQSDDAMRLINSFFEDLEANKFVLTSIPEVAIKIREAINEDEVPAKAIADIISRDPAIATKIIKAANSAFYRGYESCDSVSQSVVRLGLKTTRQLVVGFTVRDLFKTDNKILANAMRDAWDHTLYVGAIAAVLARKVGGFSPEEGMLAGILSNIGVLSVFNYLEHHPEIFEDPERLETTVNELKSEVGGLVLERWAFQDEFITCAREGEKWGRETEAKADLCDLVITASLHAGIGRRKVPRVDQVTACKRLLGEELDPAFAKEFMDGAARDIEDARALFAG